MSRGSRGVCGAVLLSALAGGCFGDKSATLSLPAALAVGTYAPVTFVDACVGSKADFCSPESVQRIESITVEPAGMLEILPVDQVPADLQAVARYGSPYAARGLAPGSGHVCVKGLFSDGTHRQACVPAAVADVAHVAVVLSCGQVVGGVAPEALVPPGLSLLFDVQLQAADGTLLAGDTLHVVDDAAFVQTTPRSYVWSAPTAGGSVTFGSRLDSSFAQTLSTYAPVEVTAIHAATGPTRPLILGQGQAMNFLLGADVGNRRACVPPEISIRTDTPGVCTGEQGAITWAAGAGVTEAWFTAVSEGTCHLGFGVAGGARDLGTLDVPFYVVNSADRLSRDHAAGEPCGDANLHVCARGRATVLVCRAKRWAAATDCSPGICDYTAAAACPDPTGCAACR
ncbi:MAG TPA: hypothetical protein VHM31_10305 [Polyangia bacterium]|nr:hypothetical protein [Polyangia bacterium]